MFERFTEEARQVVVLAQEEARQTFGHNYIGTEHVLLGLLGVPSVAASALEAAGVGLDAARSQIARIVGSGNEPPGGQIPFTPRAKKVLELSLREALSLGNNYIGPEHVLLGLLREGEGVAARVLHELGADAEQLRDQVIAQTPDPEHPRPHVRGGPPPGRRPPPPDWVGEIDDLLRHIGRNIRHQLDREPDLGDLLVVLASCRETLPGRALAEQSVDLDRLGTTIERLRSEQAAVQAASVDEIRRRLGLGLDPPPEEPAA